MREFGKLSRVRAVRRGLAPTERGGTADRDLPPDIAPLVREMRISKDDIETYRYHLDCA